MQKTKVNGNKKKALRKNDFDLLPCLWILNGIRAGEIIHLNKKSMSIGRHDDSDIVLTDAGISKNHARIDLIDDSVTVTAEMDRNALQVNGKMTEQANLHENDLLIMNDVQMKFVFKSFDDLSLNAFMMQENMLDKASRLANKEFFLQTLAKELHYAQKVGHHISCLMVVVDTIDADKNLKHVAELLKDCSRSYDVLARYQENTFSVLLKNTALDNAMVFANRLKASFVEHFSERAHIYIGISCSDQDVDINAEKLIQKALYYQEQSKKRDNISIVSRRNI